MKPIQVSFEVNGDLKKFTSMPNRTLLEVLREDLGLTGAKDSCGGEGECGACTVIMDGRAVNACFVFIGQAKGSVIETIEGISKPGELHPLQTAFVQVGAVQCGYCSPGAIMAAKALLTENPHPSEAEIREGLSGNLCRCTGYVKMIAAVEQASEELRNG
jgi:carbon-monoxide dehydrogenase small subunit